jgi:hypothetical protein
MFKDWRYHLLILIYLCSRYPIGILCFILSKSFIKRIWPSLKINSYLKSTFMTSEARFCRSNHFLLLLPREFESTLKHLSKIGWKSPYTGCLLTFLCFKRISITASATLLNSKGFSSLKFSIYYIIFK